MSYLDVQSYLLSFQISCFVKFNIGTYVSGRFSLLGMIRLSSTDGLRNADCRDIDYIEDGNILLCD